MREGEGHINTFPVTAVRFKGHWPLEKLQFLILLEAHLPCQWQQAAALVVVRNMCKWIWSLPTTSHTKEHRPPFCFSLLLCLEKVTVLKKRLLHINIKIVHHPKTKPNAHKSNKLFSSLLVTLSKKIWVYKEIMTLEEAKLGGKMW